MAQDRDKAHEISDGLIIDEAAALFSGSGVPSFSAEKGDAYLRTDNNSLWLYDTAWRQIESADISFDNVGKKLDAVNVHEAIVELRNEDTQSIEITTTTLNGTKTLTESSVSVTVLHGTATGYSVVLPDATTLFDGRRFEVDNNSSETVEVKDDGGTVLASLIAGDITVFTLDDNGTTDGEWVVQQSSSAATGITSYSVGSDTLFSTSSSTDVVITGMTVTPVQGRYGLWYSSDIEISQNNKLADVVIYVDGVALERTRRTTQGVSTNFISFHQTVAEVEVDGTEAVDVRVNISSGSLDVNGRRLLLIRLGS